MKDSEDARKMEDLTDKMIISLLEEMRSLTVQNKGVRREVTQSTSDTSAKPSEVDEMESVLKLYDDIIEQLGKIADNIATTSAAEEQHAGTVFMGSSGDGTYLPEISDEFDVYVMEEDSQYELQENLEAMDADFASKNPDNTHLLEVLPTKKPGYFFLTWSNYGLELKQRYHEKLASQQADRGGASEVGTEPRPVPIFKKLIDFTEEIEYEGRKIQVISPHKIRLHQLANPPTSIQGWPVWFRMQDQNSPAVTILTEEDKSLGKKKIQVTDLVLGVRTTMPCLSKDWLKEKQGTKWLTQAQLEKLRDTRCSIVAKSWESTEENLTVWRISYSGLERECVNALPPEPKICLIIAKAIRRKFLSKPKGLISYHIKTILFYFLDKTGSNWEKSQRANNILALLKALAEALQTRSLPLYFEPRLNTLEGMDAGTAAELERKVQEIVCSPRVLLEGCLFQSLDEDHKKEHFEKGKEINPVWFDEKPPEPSMFGEVDLGDL